MPTPRTGESEKKFIDRCMSDSEAKKDFPGEKQRLAFCGSTFRRTKKGIDVTEDQDSFDLRADVVKVDASLGLVMGYAIVCTEDGEPYFDMQGDHIPENSMLKAALDFMENSQVAKEMHGDEQVGTVVFAWPMTRDIAKAFDVEVSKTGLMIAIRPENKEMLEKFQIGELTGFSIGGTRIEDEILKD